MERVTHFWVLAQKTLKSYVVSYSIHICAKTRRPIGAFTKLRYHAPKSNYYNYLQKISKPVGLRIGVSSVGWPLQLIKPLHLIKPSHLINHCNWSTIAPDQPLHLVNHCTWSTIAAEELLSNIFGSDTVLCFDNRAFVRYLPPCPEI